VVYHHFDARMRARAQPPIVMPAFDSFPSQS